MNHLEQKEANAVAAVLGLGGELSDAMTIGSSGPHLFFALPKRTRDAVRACIIRSRRVAPRARGNRSGFWLNK